MFHRFGTFTGGIDLPDDKDATLDRPVAPVGRLERLRVPLAPVDGPPARMVVSGDGRVRRGQRLAAADGDGQVDVFAPMAGRVAGLVLVMLATAPEEWRAAPAVELVELEDPPTLEEPPLAYDWRAADDHSLRLQIDEGAATTLRHPVRPLAGWIAEARAAGVDTLIANVMENTPLVTAGHRLLTERGLQVVGGLAILARAIGTSQTLLAVDHRRRHAYRAAVAPARHYRIQAVSLPHKYPIGADKILVEVLTRREVPAEGGPVDVGVAVTDAATCWAAFRLVACGRAPCERVVTVSGARVQRPGNYLVPFGAGAGEVLSAAGATGDRRAVLGSAMSGRQLVRDAVLTGGDDALLVLPAAPAGRPTPCIRCGWCLEHCPARLNVAGLNDDFELGRLDRADRRGAAACVGCGICTYVCPARLPLAHRIRQLKRILREADAPRPAKVELWSAEPIGKSEMTE